MALKQKYDIAGVWFDSSRIEDSRNAPPLSFGCNFSREQMTGIVACANAYHLFCVSTLRIEDMEALFACKYNPQIEMFARFKMKSSFHKTKRII